MAAIMLIVAVSRALVITCVSCAAGENESERENDALLKDVSFLFMIAALLTGALIIVVAMIRGIAKAFRSLSRSYRPQIAAADSSASRSRALVGSGCDRCSRSSSA